MAGLESMTRLCFRQVLLCNFAAKFTGLTNILFHIIFGCICVNAGLLPEETSPFLATFSELAIIIIMFALGLFAPLSSPSLLCRLVISPTTPLDRPTTNGR